MIRVMTFYLGLLSPRCISWRSAEIRVASMKPKLKLELVISESRPLSVFKNGRKLETSAGLGDGIRPSAVERESSAACRIPAVTRQGATCGEERPPLARLRVPPNLLAVTVAFWASGRAWPHNLRRLCPTHRDPKHTMDAGHWVRFWGDRGFSGASEPNGRPFSSMNICEHRSRHGHSSPRSFASCSVFSGDRL